MVHSSNLILCFVCFVYFAMLFRGVDVTLVFGWFGSVASGVHAGCW